MSNLLKNLKPAAWLLLFVSILLLFSGFYYLYTRINQLTSKVENLDQTSEDSIQVVTENKDCGTECQARIEEIVDAKIATISPAAQTVVEKTTVVTEPAKQTSYIPMGSIGSTTSTDWIDIEASAVYIDLENDYGNGANVSWEASLKVAHGNGQAYARLYDDTNKIAVDFSELTTENNVTFKQVTSGNLPLWKGRNLYKVQIKSLNSFEVTYSGGRIKISY